MPASDHTSNSTTTKRCLRNDECISPSGPFLPATPEYFSRDKHRTDGLYPVCKTCKKEDLRIYRLTHRDEIAEKKKRYAQENREKIREYKHDYYKKNGERLKPKSQRYYREHRERVIAKERERYGRKRSEILEHCRKHYQANKEAYKIYSRNRRAREFAATGSHTVADERRLLKASKGKCYYCGKKIKGTPHIDHVIPLSRGGSNDIGNLVVTCAHCNLSKNNKLPHEFSDKLL